MVPFGCTAANPGRANKLKPTNNLLERKIMKTVKCDLCDFTAQGETFEEWMAALKPHYMEAHAEVMMDPHGDMQKWMADNKARFDAAQ
jgi:predicted small metal-binding protein